MPLSMASLANVLFCSTYFLHTVLAISSLNVELFSGNYEFFDLSYPFENTTINWPTTRKFEITKEINNAPGEYFYAMKEFATGEHVGTHIDAPYHFWEEGKFVGDLPLENLIVPLIIVDISSKVNGNPNFVLYKQDLDYLLNDNFGKPCLILFKFGWSKYYHDKNKYLGLDPVTKKMNFPGLSAEIMEWITKSYKNVVGIGVDVASVDPGSSTDNPVHKISAKAGLYAIENTNLNVPVPDYGCTALVMPMKIALGTGAPLRLVAICPRKIPDTF